jgi:thiol-disulfide isomerase/thioredoxin
MASFTKTVVHTQAELDEKLAAGGDANTFVLFSGAVVPSTGQSWCPDCVEAEPVITAALNKAADGAKIELLYVPLVREEYRGNAAHWARVHPTFKLERIPTLYKMNKTGTKALGSLVEDQCKDASLLEDLTA